jgi:CDK-activating kinase assembly factor MAT1
MNKKEGDFETLRDYNDYLEQVEELAWNLILNIDVDATRKKLDRFEQQQKAEASAGAGAGATSRKPQITARATLNKGVVQPKPDDADNDLVFHGLKKRVAPPKEAPFDPWGGYNIAPQYYVLQNNYDVDWYARMKIDPAHRVGGHSLQDYCSRALREAFGGFGVFIEDEIAARDVVSGDADVGTEHAAAAAVSGNDANMDDIF